MDIEDRIILSAARALASLFLWGFIYMLMQIVRGDSTTRSTVSFISLTIPFTMNAFNLIGAMVLIHLTRKANTLIQYARYLKICRHWCTVAQISHALIFLEIIGLYLWMSGTLTSLVLGTYGMQCLVRIQTVEKIKNFMRGLPQNAPPTPPIQILRDGHFEQLTDVTLAVPLHASLTPSPPSPSAPPGYDDVEALAPPEYDEVEPLAPPEYELYYPSAPLQISNDPETPPPVYNDAMQMPIILRSGPSTESLDFPPAYEDILTENTDLENPDKPI